VWNLLGFVGLMLIARRAAHRLRDGDVAGLYFIWYGIGRAWTELLFRPDAWTIGAAGIPTATLVSAGAIAFGVGVIAVNRLGKKQSRESE